MELPIAIGVHHVLKKIIMVILAADGAPIQLFEKDAGCLGAELASRNGLEMQTVYRQTALTITLTLSHGAKGLSQRHSFCIAIS